MEFVRHFGNVFLLHYGSRDGTWQCTAAGFGSNIAQCKTGIAVLLLQARHDCIHVPSYSHGWGLGGGGWVLAQSTSVMCMACLFYLFGFVPLVNG